MDSDDDDFPDKLNFISQVIDNRDISTQQEILETIFHILSALVDNHHRTPTFFLRIEQILHYIINGSNFQISGTEVYNYFSNNKIILQRRC